MDNNVTRIGLVVPPGNVAMERELPQYLPANVAMNVNRLSRPTPEVTKESLLAMIASLDQSVRDLSMCFPKPSGFIYGCTSGSFVSGPDKESELAQRITDLTGIPAVTTSTAILEGLRAVEAKRIFLLTPYVEHVNQHEVELLEHHGFSVVATDTFNCSDTRDIAKISTGQVAERVMQHASLIKSCDAVFISCTQLLTMDVIEQLERRLEKPVVTSNQCSLWAGLRLIGVPAPANAPGTLFKQ